MVIGHCCLTVLNFDHIFSTELFEPSWSFSFLIDNNDSICITGFLLETCNIILSKCQEFNGRYLLEFLMMVLMLCADHKCIRRKMTL